MTLRHIGILGGSFNPAHDGHRDISLAALKALRLHEVWWMVSPQNPLKPVAGMAPFAERLVSAKAIASHPRIIVTDIEERLGTHFTAETLGKLATRFKVCRFVWLMGADNLAQIHLWRHWARIFKCMPIAVFDRPSYTYKALAAVAARRFASARRPESALGHLSRQAAPAWAFVHHRLNPISATAIRAARDRLGDAPGRAAEDGRAEPCRRAADAAGKEV